VVTVIKSWTFESGTLEGFTGVTTYGGDDIWGLPHYNEIDVSVVSSGTYVLRCTAGNCLGYAKAPLENLPDVGGYQVEYLVHSSNSHQTAAGSGYTGAAITVVDGDGDLIAQITGDNTSYYPTGYPTDPSGDIICRRIAGAWLHHIIKWRSDNGLIHHYVYDDGGALLGFFEVRRAETIGKIPAEIRCLVGGHRGTHIVDYDNIIVSTFKIPPSRRRRAAWMNMERPAVL